MRVIQGKAFCVTLVFSLTAIFGPGCAAVSYQFGKPPERLPQSDRVQKCISDKTIVVVDAHVKFRGKQEKDVDSGVTHPPGEQEKDGWRRGLAFYRGNRRVKAERVLRIIKRPVLIKEYESRSVQYKDSLRLATRQVNAGAWVMLPGVIAVLLGGGNMLGSLPKSVDEKTSRRMLITGAIITLSGTLFLKIGGLLVYAGSRNRQKGEVYQNIFMSGDLQPELEKAIEDYNRTVLLQCQR